MKSKQFLAFLFSALLLCLAPTSNAQNGIPDECNEPYLLADLDKNCYVDFNDYAIFALHWLEDCGTPGGCEGADMSPAGGDGIVNHWDLNEFSYQWMLSHTGGQNSQESPLMSSPFAAPSSTCSTCPSRRGCGGITTSHGNPTYGVNLATGEFYEIMVDLRIPGRGLDFIWARTYRSRTGSNTNMGNGWDHSYNIKIEPDDQDFIVCDGIGRRDSYTLQDDGTWTAEGLFRVLSQNPDDSFTLTFPDTGTWTFNPVDDPNAPGKINAITDRNGNSISFFYGPSGRLVTIQDTLDREIMFSYNIDGFIDTVTDFDYRTVSYQYYDGYDPNGSFGDLKSVTSPAVTGTPNGNNFPEGKTTVFTYTTGFGDERLNHNLLTITDPNGQTFLHNVYSPPAGPNDPNFDHITRQIWGEPNDIIDMTYIPQAPGSENNFAVVKTITNDRMGNVGEHFFDNRNQLVILRQYTGRADPNEPTNLDENINPPTSPLRGDDPPYFETRYQYNAEYSPTRIDYPNGNYVTNVYEADLDPNATQRCRGNLRERHLYAGTLEPVSDQSEIVELFEYDDGMGGCCGTNFVTRYVDPNGNEFFYEYDEQGNRIRKICKRPGSGSGGGQTLAKLDSDPNIVEEWEYNEFGQVTTHILPDNGSNHRRRDEFTYYTPGDAHQNGYLKNVIVDANVLALTTTYEYNTAGNVTRKIDPNGNDKLLIVNQLNQVVREISPEVTDGSGVRYQKDIYYDKNNNVVRIDIQNIDDQGILQPNTHFTTIYKYEILNNLISKTSEVDPANSIIVEYAYDLNRNQTLMRSGEATNGNQPNNVVRTIHDERNRVFQVIRAEADPDQSTTQYDYDGNGNLTKVHEGLEGSPRITTNQYDGFNRHIKSTDPMGNVTEYHYNANGNRISQRIDGELTDIPGDANNVRLYEKAYVYDSLNRLIRTEVSFFDPNTQNSIDDGSVVTQTEYSDNSQVLKVTDDNSHQTLTIYDTANRWGTITDAKGNTVTYTYDENSNIIAATEVEKSDLGDPNETYVTTYEYDNLNRLIRDVDNVGNTTEYKYDSRDNRTRIINAQGRETCYEYDGLNRLTREVSDMDGDGADPADANDIVTTQTWDDNSRLTSQTDDSDNTTTYEYDSLDRKIETRYADNTDDQYCYDIHDNRTQTTDGSGSVVDYTYDALNRVTAKAITPGAGVSNDTTSETYKYDGMSRTVYAQDDDSLITLSYDSLSHAMRETLNGQTTSYTYDGLDNKLSSTYPGGRVITSTYDELNRIKAISDAGGTIATYNYIGPIRMEKKESANGTQTLFGYDGISNDPNDFGVKQIVSTTHSVVSSGTIIDDRTYTWDQMYNKTQRKDVRIGGPQFTHDYSYDDADRLTQTTVKDSASVIIRNTIYALDGVGNRSIVVGSPDPGPYTMDNTTPEPADLQMNQYTTTSFDGRLYEKNGNLVTIDNGLPTQKDIEYDYRNQMVTFTDTAIGQVHTYSYDSFGRRIQCVIDSAGSPQTTRYFFDDGQVIEEQDGVGTTQVTYVYGNYIDEVLNMQRGGIDYFYHADDLYNVMAVTDANADVVERYEYEDYGRPIDPTTLAPIVGSPSAIGNTYHFTGRRYDAETGLYYYRTRYLDPRAGRFTSRDTLGIWGDEANFGNASTYAANNPATYLDPYGWAIDISDDGLDCDPKALAQVQCKETRTPYAMSAETGGLVGVPWEEISNWVMWIVICKLKPIFNDAAIKSDYGDCFAEAKECIRQHEQEHIEQYNKDEDTKFCKLDNDHCRGKDKCMAVTSGQGEAESGAYDKEQECLKKEIANAKNDPKKKKCLEKDLKDVRKLKAGFDSKYAFERLIDKINEIKKQQKQKKTKTQKKK